VVQWQRKRRNVSAPHNSLDHTHENDQDEAITPDNGKDGVRLKRAGNFGKLVVVKISDDFQFAARMVDRRLLGKGRGKWATLSWDAMIAGEPEQEMHRSFPIKKVASKRETT